MPVSFDPNNWLTFGFIGLAIFLLTGILGEHFYFRKKALAGGVGDQLSELKNRVTELQKLPPQIEKLEKEKAKLQSDLEAAKANVTAPAESPDVETLHKQLAASERQLIEQRDNLTSTQVQLRQAIARAEEAESHAKSLSSSPATDDGINKELAEWKSRAEQAMAQVDELNSQLASASNSTELETAQTRIKTLENQLAHVESSGPTQDQTDWQNRCETAESLAQELQSRITELDQQKSELAANLSRAIANTNSGDAIQRAELAERELAQMQKSAREMVEQSRQAHVQELEQLKTERDSLVQQMSDIETNVKTYVSRWQQEVQEQTESRHQLELQVSNLASQYATSLQAAREKAAEELRGVQAERDQLAESINEQKAGYETSLDNLSKRLESISSISDQVAELQEVNANLHEKLAEAEKTNADREDLVQRVHDLVEVQRQAEAKFQRELESAHERNQTLQKDILEHNERIVRLENDLEQADNDRRALEAQIAERSARITELENQPKDTSAQDELRSARNHVARLESRVAELENEAKWEAEKSVAVPESKPEPELIAPVANIDPIVEINVEEVAEALPKAPEKPVDSVALRIQELEAALKLAEREITNSRERIDRVISEVRSLKPSEQEDTSEPTTPKVVETLETVVETPTEKKSTGGNGGRVRAGSTPAQDVSALSTVLSDIVGLDDSHRKLLLKAGIRTYSHLAMCPPQRICEICKLSADEVETAEAWVARAVTLAGSEVA